MAGHNDTRPASADKRRLQVQMRLGNLSLKALGVLDRCMDSPNQQVALAAARDVLDRRFGKPRQEVSATVEVASMAEQHLDALRALAQRTIEARAIDVTNVLAHVPNTLEDEHGAS